MAQSSGALKVLILAGTAEARIAAGMATLLPELELIVSYSGATREQEPLGRVPPEMVGKLIGIIAAHRKPPRPRPPVRTAAELIASLKEPPLEWPQARLSKRTGGFGGAAGLAAWLRSEGVVAVIDATHPFAVRMQANAVEACSAAAVPRLRLLRPEWPARPGWVGVPSLDRAARALPAGARVLLTSGRDWAPFAGRTDCRFWLRSIEPVALPGAIQPILARPPFAPADELALMRRLGVTHLVAKNSGGDAAKLDAAEALAISVVMVARPAPPSGVVVASPAAALAWLAAVLNQGSESKSGGA